MPTRVKLKLEYLVLPDYANLPSSSYAEKIVNSETSETVILQILFKYNHKTKIDFLINKI